MKIESWQLSSGLQKNVLLIIPSMSKFKIGDRIIYIGSNDLKRGKAGVITELKLEGFPGAYVLFDGGKKEMELVWLKNIQYENRILTIKQWIAR